MTERERLIGWLLRHLPGNPDLWHGHTEHLKAGFQKYSLESLRELKQYATAQIKIYNREKRQFERTRLKYQRTK